MYHKVNIQKLSQAQIAKLLRGQRIRVKGGQGHVVHLSAEQAKKLASAERKGAGCCVQFDPYQCDMHRGEGLFTGVSSSLSKALVPVAVRAGKAVAPALIDAGSNALKDYVAGNGFASNAGKALGAVAGKGVAPRAVASRAGKKSAPRRGRGIASSLFKAVAPALVDVGADALKGAVRGRGRKKKGGALNVAGGALYNAGYSQGQGRIGGVIGNALGSAFIPF